MKYECQELTKPSPWPGIHTPETVWSTSGRRAVPLRETMRKKSATRNDPIYSIIDHSCSRWRHSWGRSSLWSHAECRNDSKDAPCYDLSCYRRPSENNDLIAEIARLLSSSVKKESIRVRKTEKIFTSKVKIRELPPLPLTSDPSDESDIPFKYKKKRRSHHGKKNSKNLSSSTSSFHDDVWIVSSSGKSKEDVKCCVSQVSVYKTRNALLAQKCYDLCRDRLQRPSIIAFTNWKTSPSGSVRKPRRKSPNWSRIQVCSWSRRILTR